MDKRQEALRLRRDGLSYAEIGEQLKISRQRVQQLCRPPTAIYNLIKERAKGRCEKCGITAQSGHIHHRDDADENYNDVPNLQYLCASCHRTAHTGIDGVSMAPAEITALRKDLGLRMEEFAVKLRVSYFTVYRWEAGIRKPTSRTSKKLEKLRQALKDNRPS